MEWKVDFAPSYSILKIKLRPGEVVIAEPEAMVATLGDIKVETKMKGGFLKALARKVFAGESMFMNTYIGGDKGGEIWLAPPVPGDIKYIELKNSELHVQDFAYLAHHGDIEAGVKFKGFKGLLAGGGGVFWLKLKGTGGVWICGYGGIDEIELKPGEKITVDNFHALAIEHTVDWKIKKFGGWKTFILGGEGLAIEAKGPGRVYIQSRTLPSLVELLRRYIKK